MKKTPYLLKTSLWIKILELEKGVKDIEKTIRKKKESIQPLLNKARKHEEQILKLQDQILTKAREKTDLIKNKVVEGSKVVTNFEKFFEKKTEVEDLISKIEQEKKELEVMYTGLEKKAIAFDASTKSSSLTGRVKELEKDLEKVTEKKSKFKEDLEKLIKLVKG